MFCWSWKRKISFSTVCTWQMASSSTGWLDFEESMEHMLSLHYSPWTCWKPELLEFIAAGVVCVQYPPVPGPTFTHWNPDPMRISGKAPNIISKTSFSLLHLGIPIFIKIWKFCKDKYPIQSQWELCLIQARSILLYNRCLLILENVWQLSSRVWSQMAQR